jgi:hypothetical protein
MTIAIERGSIIVFGDISYNDFLLVDSASRGPFKMKE